MQHFHFNQCGDMYYILLYFVILDTGFIDVLLETLMYSLGFLFMHTACLHIGLTERVNLYKNKAENSNVFSYIFYSY